MSKSMVRIGFEVLAALGLVASMSQAASAAVIFDDTIPVPRDCEQHELPANVGERQVGRGVGVACNGIVDLVAEAFPSILDLNDDFEVEVNLRSNGTLIRGIGDNTVADGPEATFEDDPGGSLTLQVVVEVF